MLESLFDKVEALFLKVNSIKFSMRLYEIEANVLCLYSNDIFLIKPEKTNKFLKMRKKLFVISFEQSIYENFFFSIFNVLLFSRSVLYARGKSMYRGEK